MDCWSNWPVKASRWCASKAATRLSSDAVARNCRPWPHKVSPLRSSPASGVSSYAGIPLTHRDYAQSCLFVTGHLKDGTADLDWHSLVRPCQTVVIYMGLGGLPEICRQLIQHGAPPTLPLAVAQDGSISTQRVVTGTLADIPETVVKAGLKSPCLTIIGEVVKLHDSLAWFTPVTHETTT